MPELDDFVLHFTSTYTNTFKKHYVGTIFDRSRRHGKTTRWFKQSSKRVLDGNRMEFELRRAVNRGAVASMDPMLPMPKHKPGNFGRFNARWSTNNTAANDFMTIHTPSSTTWWDIKKMADSNWKDAESFIMRDIREVVEDFEEKMSKYTHLPANGRLGSIATSGKRDDDSFNWDDTTSYTSGASRAALRMNAMSIALIGNNGDNIEIRTSGGTLRCNNVKVDFVHPVEQVIHVRLTSDSVDGAGNPVTDLNAVAATDELFINSSYGVGVKGSLDAFFDESATYYSDENGVAIDRTTTDGKIFMPLIINAAQSVGGTVDLNSSHLRHVGHALGHSVGDGNAEVNRIAIMARDQSEALIKLGADKEIVIVEGGGSGPVAQNLAKNFGFTGFTFHDPNVGAIPMVVDDFASYGKIDFIDPSAWEVATPIASGYDVVTGGGPLGMFYQMSESDGSGTPSFRYAYRGVGAFCLVNTWPRGDLRLKNLNTSA